jgi:hypothetical protein
VITGSVDDYLSPLSTTQPTTVLRVQRSVEGPISIGEINPAWNAMAYALQGSFRVGDRLVEEYQTALFNNEADYRTEIAAISDGPLWVTGGIAVTTSDGTQLEARTRVTLCRCGASANKPLCDGSHKEVGFTDV